MSRRRRSRSPGRAGGRSRGPWGCPTGGRHAGYQSPTGNYVALEQTKGATRGWIEAQTNRARQTGELDAAGRTWLTYERTPKIQRSLLSKQASADGLTTLITGTGTFEELAAFAEALKPVQP